MQVILVYSHVIQLQMSALWVINGPTNLALHSNDLITYFQPMTQFVLHMKTVRKKNCLEKTKCKLCAVLVYHIV